MYSRVFCFCFFRYIDSIRIQTISFRLLYYMVEDYVWVVGDMKSRRRNEKTMKYHTTTTTLHFPPCKLSLLPYLKNEKKMYGHLFLL